MYGYYTRKEYPTVIKLLISLQKSYWQFYVITVMKQIGFKYKKRDKRKIMMKIHDLV